MNAAKLVSFVLACGVGAAAQKSMREPETFFREQIGLNEDQIATITQGRAVTKVLPTHTPSEIVVFGAVFVKGSPGEYVKLAFDMDRLRRFPSYLAVGQFSDPPRLSDLGGFTLEPEDIANLKDCRPGKCDVQLPAKAMEEIRKGLDWSRPNIAAQVNDRFRRMALDVLLRYRDDGGRVLGSYHDKDRPFDMQAELQALLGRSDAVSTYLPGLNRYLMDYPNADLTNIESMFYWEKVSFGLKPTVRLNHASAYRSTGPRGEAEIVVVKQLYASHYFQLALDLSACVTDSLHTGDKGFYLISLKVSTQQGLTGFRGSILRSIIVAKTRSALERVLANTKKVLEER